MDKIKKALLDDCREHLILAVGSAAGAGEHETAARINAILVDIDIACEMCYTRKNARGARKNEEVKTMKIERYILSYEWRQKIESCTHSGIVDRKVEDFNEFFDDIEKARERVAELEKDIRIITEGNATTTNYNANFRLIDRK